MKKSLVRSTGIVAFSTLLSRTMGFARDMIVAHIFGATAFMDGFWVAFRIPNLFRRLVAEGALTISFVPVYTECLIKNGEDAALDLAQKTLSILLMVLTVITALGEIFSGELIALFGYGFTDPGQISLTVELNRIMFPYLFLVSIVAFAMGYLNSRRIFFAPAFAPVLLNVGIITGALVLSRFFSEPLYGLALGVILGGLLQLILQVPYLAREGFRTKFSVDFNHPGIRAIFRMLGPALFGVSIYQLNILTGTILASMLPEGSISYIYYSDRINEFVLGIFIISIGSVMLPEMSGMSTIGDFKKIRQLYSGSVRGSLFFAVPAMIALMTIGLPIVSVLFMRGKFEPVDAAMTEKALFFASAGIVPISVVRITAPAFYSLKETKIPVLAAGASFIVNILSGYFLMQTALKHAGLTLAVSIAAAVQMFILLFFIRKKIGRIETAQILLPLLKFTVSGAIMAVVIIYICGGTDWLYAPFASRLAHLSAAIISGGVLYLLSCYLLKVDEVLYLKKALIDRFRY